MGLNMFNEGYFNKPQIHPRDEEKFRDILKPRNWDFGMFKDALIAASKIETYPFATPDSIHLGALRKFIDDIKKRTLETGNEHGKGFFVDLKDDKLISGKTTRGNDSSCETNWEKPDNDHKLKRVISLHSHPLDNISMHLSPADYIHFLGDPELISMIMTCADTELLVLKSSRTPVSPNKEELKKSIGNLSNEFLGKNPKMQDIIRYQKAVCLENALSLYIATSSNKDLAKKVDLFDDEKIYS